jgi:Cdc6-like AAA superfamily ATPase
MPNPKDWFRRRGSASLENPAKEEADPFAGEGVLDLGRSAKLVHDAAKPAESKPRGFNETRLGGTVPPPRQVAPTPRKGGTLDRSAFTVRPEIVGPASLIPPPTVANGAATAAPASNGPNGAAAARSAFAIRRGGAHVQLAPAAPPARLATPAVPPPKPSAPTPPPAATAAAAADSEQADFALAAPGVGWKRSRATPTDAGRVSALLRDAFTPTRPKQNSALFSGRFKQMQRIIAAIEEERAHVMVYGERGSGKTSLANVLAGKAEQAGYLVLRFACSSELSFEDIFRSFLRRLPANLLPDGVGARHRAGTETLEQLLPAHCGVSELMQVFERISDKHVILIIDEYDRVTSEETKARLAELLKNISDAALPVTLLIIGVAENVGQLLGKHPSLQRTIVTIPMPLMSRREIDGIVVAGEERSGLRFDPWTRQAVADFAQGLPYHAQLLCLFAARNAARRQSSTIERGDLRYAVQRAAEETEARIKEAYDLAVGAHESASFRDVLFYAARSRTDEFGSFTAADVVAAASDGNVEGLSLLALQFPLKKLTEAARGAVLRRTMGPGGLRYQFSSQTMRHHVLCRQAEQRGLV